MKAVIFGAGNIGRGFLASLLVKAGYIVTFIDVDTIKISLINAYKEYPVYIVSDQGIQEEIVRGVNAISCLDEDSTTHAIVEADVILTAVGKEALRAASRILALGLMERIVRRPSNEIHVVVVACENVQDNTSFLRDLLLAQVSEEYRTKIEDRISFPNCVVDRIVPNTLPNGIEGSPLAVCVEDYFQLAIDQTMLKAPFPGIPGIDLSGDLTATLEQKLFTLNMAHAIVGYFGYLKGYQFIHEAVMDKDIQHLLVGAIAEVNLTITTRHQTILSSEQEKYSHKVIKRFRNPYLRDEVTRVTRQPKRKLGSQDRLIFPALLSWNQGRIPSYLTSGISAALHFDFHGDPQSEELKGDIQKWGIAKVLQEVSGLSPESEVSKLVQSNFIFRSL